VFWEDWVIISVESSRTANGRSVNEVFVSIAVEDFDTGF
jgi:hypothetical protein